MTLEEYGIKDITMLKKPQYMDGLTFDDIEPTDIYNLRRCVHELKHYAGTMGAGGYIVSADEVLDKMEKKIDDFIYHIAVRMAQIDANSDPSDWEITKMIRDRRITDLKEVLGDVFE